MCCGLNHGRTLPRAYVRAYAHAPEIVFRAAIDRGWGQPYRTLRKLVAILTTKG